MSFATLPRRLQRAVDRSGGPEACWPWIKGTRNGGYGQFGGIENGERYVFGAHRVAYELHHGVTLTVDQCVLHRCDNPPCCNPSHLFLGDRRANSDDKVSKGRQRNGTKHGSDHKRSKLTEQVVSEMRAAYATGAVSQPQLSRRYGVRQSTVNSVLLRKTWRHVV